MEKERTKDVEKIIKEEIEEKKIIEVIKKIK